MNEQISMDELMKPQEKEITEIPVRNGYVKQIPEDVWENRCQICIHKRGAKNVPCDLSVVWRSCYDKLIPCRIISIAHCCDIPGECKSFAPRMDVYGICKTCKHSNHFHEGFCMKDGHAPEHQIYIGQDYGKECYRHDLCGCDDYEPDSYVKEGKY